MRHRPLCVLFILVAALAAAAVGCKQASDEAAGESRRAPSPQHTVTEAPATEPAEAEAAAAPAPEIAGPDDPRVAALMKKDEAERGAFADVPLDRPLGVQQRRTTSCDIFLGNLDARIAQLRKQHEAAPSQRRVIQALAAELFGRGQLNGSLEEMAEALALAEQGLEGVAPDAADDGIASLRMLRARILMTLHRFDEARTELERVKASAPTTPGVDEALASLALETGNDLAAGLEAQAKAFEAGATFDNYVAAANARAQLGHFALAAKLYGQAERAYDDVAPIPLAWLSVIRGLMAMHTGDYALAREFYAVAYERCPRYPMAAEHLAEIEGRLGNVERSVELYEAVIEQTNNPEFMAALGELLLERAGAGDEARARALFARADKRLRELLERFPAAFSDHGAGFYLGPGDDPKLALELLQRNHTLRPTPHAKQGLAEAQLANDQLDEAQASIEAVLASPVEFAEKHWTAARIALARGDAAAAERHAARARELNPRIEDLEGPLREPAQGEAAREE